MLKIIKDKYNGKLTQICVDSLKCVSDKELFTTEKLNEMVEDVIFETLYYDEWKLRR